MSLSPAAVRWSALIHQHEASGLSIREFAERHGVNAGTLSWWRHKLKRTSPSAPPSSPSSSPPAFVTLEVVPTPAPDRAPHATVVLVLDHFPAHVVVDRDTDLPLLRDLLGALC